ncbi:hypothetical protein EDB80DRAFT_331903 [Ilyonectria destructans]|nr:hypothetical protein EDB80DRAFT_331903 [Ilyonectria destructans]
MPQCFMPSRLTPHTSCLTPRADEGPHDLVLVGRRQVYGVEPFSVGLVPCSWQRQRRSHPGERCNAMAGCGKGIPDGMGSEMSRAARVRLRMFGVRVIGVRVIQARPRFTHPSPALAPPRACRPGSRSRSRYSCSDSDSGDSSPTSDGGGVVVVWFFGALALGFCKCCGTQVGGPVCQVQAGRDESSLVKLVAGHRLIREMPSLPIPHPVHVALPRPSPSCPQCLGPSTPSSTRPHRLS